MPRRHDGLFVRIANFRALHEAALRAVRGKRRKPGAAAFMARLEPECLRLERQLNDGSYRPGRHVDIVVRDPKRRVVSAAPLRDRVVHHALHAVLAPIFERGFIADSFANRVGKGTHRAIARYEQFRDRYRHVLRADIAEYFASIDHAALKADLRRRIACDRTLALCDAVIDAVIDGAATTQPTLRYFDGDDLFAPLARRRGLPLGNLTSQFFANVYLDGFDHFVKEVLRAPYLRYVDDFALFADDPGRLRQWQERIAAYLQGRRLLLHPRKTWIAPSAEPAIFLGLELRGGGQRRLPAHNVHRFRARLDDMRGQWRAGTIDAAQVRQRVGGWVAHARHAHTRALRHTLFNGGWFDPFWADGRPVEGAIRL
ncbi:MAG: reverse transcriptase domain-containing protein [Betaproteobacteria bacterium]